MVLLLRTMVAIQLNEMEPKRSNLNQTNLFNRKNHLYTEVSLNRNQVSKMFSFFFSFLFFPKRLTHTCTLEVVINPKTRVPDTFNQVYPYVWETYDL